MNPYEIKVCFNIVMTQLLHDVMDATFKDTLKSLLLNHSFDKKLKRQHSNQLRNANLVAPFLQELQKELFQSSLVVN